MKIPMVQTVKNEGILIYLVILTGFFLLLETSFFIQCNQSYFADAPVVLHQLHIPITVLPGIIYFLGAQLLVHTAFTILVWLVTLPISYLFKLSSNKKLFLALSLWVIGMVT